jgi:hypothetical protein
MMKIVSGIVLMIGGIGGTIIGLMGSVQVTSSLDIIDGLDLSWVLAGFSIFVFLSGIANLISSSNGPS